MSSKLVEVAGTCLRCGRRFAAAVAAPADADRSRIAGPPCCPRCAGRPARIHPWWRRRPDDPPARRGGGR